MSENDRKIEWFFNEAKSWCFCGHLGDGPSQDVADPMWRSFHDGINGHGRCLVMGCDCGQFTWKKYTHRYEETILERGKSK